MRAVWLVAVVAIASCNDDNSPAEPNDGGATPSSDGATLSPEPSGSTQSGDAARPQDAAVSDASAIQVDAAGPAVADAAVSDPADASAAPNLSHACEAHFEPNDTPALACSIELNQRVESELAQPSDVSDHFAFAIQKDRVYTLTLASFSCSSLDLQVSAHGSGQAVQQFAKTVYGGRMVTEFTASASGPAQLAVKLRSGDSCAYQFTILPSTRDGLQHDATTKEPNDSGSTAAPLAAPVRVSSDVASPNDVADFYTFAVEQGKTYTLQLVALACAATDVQVAALGSGQPVELLAYTQYGGNRVHEFTASSTGDARVAITLRVEGSCAYEVVVLPSTKDGLQHDPGTFEPNDTSSTAAPLAGSLAGTADLASPRDSVDHYTFPVEMGRTVSLAVTSKGCPALDVSFASLGSGQTVQQLAVVQYTGPKTYEVTPSATGLGLLRVALRVDGSCAYDFSAR
jgi:hypothetical protein